MSYAIIRNAKYTKSKLNLVYRHNERKNTNYSNEDIQKNNSANNFTIKSCNMPYEKKFNEIRKTNDLQGRIKSTSNIACEYVITASPDFFEGKSNEEVKRYFETAYKFVTSFKNLGEEYIISAKVHMDESNPHMHLVYLPVVHTFDNKSGKNIDKICCTDFWKGKNSYKMLQDNFYKYMTKAGFELERGETSDNTHIKIADLKKITHYDLQKYEKEQVVPEKPIETKDVKVLEKEYKRVIQKCNTLQSKLAKEKAINVSVMEKASNLEYKNTVLQQENIVFEQTIENQEKEIHKLKEYIHKALDCVSILFGFPLDRLKRIIQKYVKEFDENVRTRYK